MFFHNTTRNEIAGLVATYPENPDSPAGVGASNTTYPEFKRLAAILGYWEFTSMARLLLKTPPPDEVPARSWQAIYERSGTPILGTYHSTGLPHLFLETDHASTAIQDRYISFVDCLDPNVYAASTPSCYLTFWPTWQEKQLLMLGAHSTRLIDDNARAASFEYIRARLESLCL